MTEPQDLYSYIEAWHERAGNVDNGEKAVTGAFLIIDWGWPEVEVYTHTWDPEVEDWELVGNPVPFGERVDVSLEEAVRKATTRAEKELREQGRWHP